MYLASKVYLWLLILLLEGEVRKMGNKLDEIMLPISEALLNLKEGYKGTEVANEAYGRLCSYLDYTPQKAVIILNQLTGISRLEVKK